MGVDSLMPCLPDGLKPGIGLRPGGERPDIEPFIAPLFLSLYESAAAFADRGFCVAIDAGHHDSYSQPLSVLPRCARLLASRPAWLVGVRCPLAEVRARREATGMPASDAMIEAWERAVHSPGIYDLEVDSSLDSPEEAAVMVLKLTASGQARAFRALAGLAP